MAELQNPDPLVEAVAKARAEASRRPERATSFGTLNITPSGHAYIYSGFSTGAAANVLKTYLEFNTTEDYITGFVDFCKQNLNQDDNDTLRIYFNDIQVYQVEHESSEQAQQSPERITIPPYTRVRMAIQSTGNNMTFAVKYIGNVI